MYTDDDESKFHEMTYEIAGNPKSVSDLLTHKDILESENSQLKRHIAVLEKRISRAYSALESGSMSRASDVLLGDV